MALKERERKKGRHPNLTDGQWEALRVLAFRRRTTISNLVRQAVDLYLTQEKRRKK